MSSWRSSLRNHSIPLYFFFPKNKSIKINIHSIWFVTLINQFMKYVKEGQLNSRKDIQIKKSFVKLHNSWNIILNLSIMQWYMVPLIKIHIRRNYALPQTKKACIKSSNSCIYYQKRKKYFVKIIQLGYHSKSYKINICNCIRFKLILSYWTNFTSSKKDIA